MQVKESRLKDESGALPGVIVFIVQPEPFKPEES